MKVHELIEILELRNQNLHVYLATTKHETLPITHICEGTARSDPILLFSSHPVCTAEKPNTC